MIQQKNNIDYYYNPAFDTLNIYLGKANDIYSTEEEKGLYFIRDESSDELIGVEILYFSSRNKDRLKDKIPIEFDFELLLQK